MTTAGVTLVSSVIFPLFYPVAIYPIISSLDTEDSYGCGRPSGHHREMPAHSPSLDQAVYAVYAISSLDTEPSLNAALKLFYGTVVGSRARGRSRDARPGVSSLLPVTCYLLPVTCYLLRSITS